MVLFANSEYPIKKKINMAPTIKEKVILWMTKEMNNTVGAMIRVGSECNGST